LVVVQTEVNRHLEPDAQPRLVWDHEGKLSFQVWSASLVGFLWTQFAQTISGRMAYHACATCGRWIRLGSGGARQHRAYCSNACRTRGLRERQEEARQLHSAGEPIASIAARLNSDVDTVTGWVMGRPARASGRRAKPS
jgi:hypothetical protein